MEAALQWETSQDYSDVFFNDTFEFFGDPGFNFALPEISDQDLESLPTQSFDLNHLCSDIGFEFMDIEDGQDEMDLLPTLPTHEMNCHLPETKPQNLSEGRSKSLKIHCDDSQQRKSYRQRSIGYGTDHHREPEWETSVVVFAAKPDAKIEGRRRNRFGASRRREVAMNRLVGACIQCRLRKASCSFGLPCRDCVRRAGSISLGQQLCTRQGLVNARFNNVDLIGATTFEQLLDQHPYPFIAGTGHEISIVWPGPCHRASLNVSLVVKVQDIQPFSHIRANHGITQTLRFFGYNYFHDQTHSDSYVAILPESMPTLEDLQECNFDGYYGCHFGPFSGLNIAFGKFAERYCDLDAPLPMQTLLRKTMRMRRLMYMLTWAPQYTPAVGEPVVGYVPSWIKLQLWHLIGKGVMELEAEILDELDHLLSRPEGIGRRQPIATWACLWILILTYRSHFVIISFSMWLDDGFRTPRLALGKHIYNALTSVYSALYKTTSPLTLDWRAEEVSEMLGNDPELISLFCNIKTEMFWCYAARNHLCGEDTLFRTLVLDNENKLIESHKKLAKRRGLL